MSEIKYNEHQTKGKCQVCGKVNHTSIWKICIQKGWFRGDDDYVGKVCKLCKREFINNLKGEIE